jgi:predicted NBD/HSP70 family sugar kinase
MRFELPFQVKPSKTPPLDPDFIPAALVHTRFFEQAVSEGIPFAIALERSPEEISRYDTFIYPDEHPNAYLNCFIIERILKFLLWQRGGWKVYLGGSAKIAREIQAQYTAGGARDFDVHFLGELVYEHPFTIVSCKFEEVPAAKEVTRPIGRHLNGCRIGFDLGASDRKVSAVIDGKVVFSEEVVWEPKKQDNPEYHYNEIMAALKTAASKMPRVDAIGGSSAGIYINNQPKAGSLFRGIPLERRPRLRGMFDRIQKEMGIPLEVINDGDVTALAGSMSLEANGILGIALGSSEAAGYVDMDGQILGWLNELAFAPVDYNLNAVREEWSGDIGCGASYFSQQCVFRLAPAAGIKVPENITDAARLEYVQKLLAAGHEGALKIWQSMGVYLGYALVHYAQFYDINHVLILGRCTSGKGGNILLEEANQVLAADFPHLGESFHIQLPDEKSRRVGQSIAAASLPEIKS